MPGDPLIAQSVALPIAIDLGATVLFSITGVMVAIRRHYNPIGLFVLGLACGLGGGLNAVERCIPTTVKYRSKWA